MLLHGPPGTGKTSLACSCAHDSGVKLLSVNGPEIVSEVYGKSEKELHQVFDKAKQAASAMVRVFVFSHFLKMGSFLFLLLFWVYDAAQPYTRKSLSFFLASFFFS